LVVGRVGIFKTTKQSHDPFHARTVSRRQWDTSLCHATFVIWRIAILSIRK
jgi:hypothetical protein